MKPDNLVETFGWYGASRIRHYKTKIKALFGVKDGLENLTAIQRQVYEMQKRDLEIAQERLRNQYESK